MFAKIQADITGGIEEIGREYVYQLMIDSFQLERVQRAIDCFRGMTETFNRNENDDKWKHWDGSRSSWYCDLSKVYVFSETKLRYDIRTANVEMWRRDHLIHKIKVFAADLFPAEEGKQIATKAWLMHKVCGELTELAFIARGYVEFPKAEIVLEKLFTKLEGKSYLSYEEKVKKHSSP